MRILVLLLILIIILKLVLVLVLFSSHKSLNSVFPKFKAMKRGEEIESKILAIISESVNPVSTRELCLKIGRAWHSVNTHCLKMQLAGNIHGFKVGNMNLWVKKNEK